MLLLYRSPDLRSWTYVNEAYACPATDMIECPDLAELGGRDLLIFSPTNHPKREDGFANLHASVYSVGELDLASGTFAGEEYREIDGGFDFYAPQTVRHPDGRTIMIAWMQMWKRSMPTAEAGLGWAGAMTLPANSRSRRGRCSRLPSARSSAIDRTPSFHQKVGLAGARRLEGVHGDRLELIAEVELGSAAAFTLSLFVGTEHRTVLRYDRLPGLVTLDRSRSGVPIRELHENGAPSALRSRRYEAAAGRLRLRAFLDGVPWRSSWVKASSP
jgi:beta-fructofuranosidase